MTITRRHIVRPAVLFMLSALPCVSAEQTVDQLVHQRVEAQAVEFKGKRAIKIVEDGQVPNGEAYAVVKGTPFHNGTIEVEMAGLPAKCLGGCARVHRPGVPVARRPLRNASTSDQPMAAPTTRCAAITRRQYILPRLRFRRSRKAPEKCESYVDLEPGSECGPHHRAGDSRAAHVHGGAAALNHGQSQARAARRATWPLDRAGHRGVFHGSFNQARVGKAVGTAGWSGARGLQRPADLPTLVHLV